MPGRINRGERHTFLVASLMSAIFYVRAGGKRLMRSSTARNYPDQRLHLHNYPKPVQTHRNSHIRNSARASLYY